MEETSNPEQELNQNVAELSATIKRTNSPWFVFSRGVINGIGTFIGATIVAAIVITLLAQVLGFFEINFDIKNYLNSLLSK